IISILLTAWIFSRDRRNVNWRVIIWGIGLQFLFATFIFHIPVGLFLFERINDVVIKVLSFAQAGMYFTFGRLALSPHTTGPYGGESLGFILAFQALPAVISSRA
ncbi:MAG: Na+ dependent nucleoside transporter N-terminal domain-containing protein, partial [Thermoplasmata archaeon]